MNRQRILTAAVLILFAETAWIFWPRREEPAAPANTPGESFRGMKKLLRRPEPPVEGQPASDLFAFEHDGKTVTVDLSEARRCVKRMVRKDMVAVAANDDEAGVPKPGAAFLSWPSRKSKGEETIKSRRCWVIDFTNPSPRSVGDAHYVVRAFISKSEGTLIRMQGYNWDGQLETIYAVERWKRGQNGTVWEKEATGYNYFPGTKKVKGEVKYVLRPAVLDQ